jgi:putative ABC transport system permease protein
MMTTMEEVRAEGLAGDRLAALVLAAFAAFGLLLAAVGIYGVTAHGIERRIPEFGVRMALGSTRGGIVRTAAGRPLRLAARGCAAGAASAWVLGAILERVIFNTTTADPAAIVACVLVVVAVTVLACGIPAVRAARVPASVALRRRG